MHARILLITILVFSNKLYCINPVAFPGAEGYGKFATGGREGKVAYVTNLNDSGKGSLRYALSKIEGSKTILFAISGTIYLKSALEIDEGNLTIAGQTAPGDGICIAGYGLDIEADNIIIRYLRIRPGDINHVETDALTIKRSSNVIVDHCSMSWSTDETCSCYDNSNFTLQWSIISESLNKSVHHKGKHGYGGIWGGKNATFHHNLLAHHTSRNPRLQGSRYHKKPELEKVEITNNVVYNWKSKCIYAGEGGTYAITENYFIKGPATGTKASFSILEPYQPFANYYFCNNNIEGNNTLSKNNKSAILNRYDTTLVLLDDFPFETSNVIIEKPIDAYNNIVEHAGASLKRDIIDQRIIKELEDRDANFGEKGIINSQLDVGGWPKLETSSAPLDSDQDGIPDEWEDLHNLDKDNSKDGNFYNLDKLFTNLEVYLNSICN